MMHYMRAAHRGGGAGGWRTSSTPPQSCLLRPRQDRSEVRTEVVVSVRTREPRAWNGEQVNTGDHDDVRIPSTRATRILLAGAVLGVASVLAVGCGSPSYPGEPLETLPAHTAGAVSLGGLGVETFGGRTLVFAFDDDGTVLGRIEGERVDATRVLFSADSLVTVTGEAVTVLTEQGRTDIPIDEHTISAFSHNPVSGAATVWFVRGRANNFVAIGADQQVRQGSVDGMVHTAAYCGTGSSRSSRTSRRQPVRARAGSTNCSPRVSCSCGDSGRPNPSTAGRRAPRCAHRTVARSWRSTPIIRQRA